MGVSHRIALLGGKDSDTKQVVIALHAGCQP